MRGFDGERTLMASRGWYWRNDIAWTTPVINQEFYLALDYGRVSGYGNQYLTGRHLSGSQIGLRGNAFNTDYDAFIGMPIVKPDNFVTSSLALGFNLAWHY